MTSMERLLAARALLETLTPLNSDCGALCGAACCQPDADGENGMLLFPGEETLYESADWARLMPAEGPGGEPMTLLVCEGLCPRKERPLACRFFPATPLVGHNGQPALRMDRGARGVCPLCASGLNGLSPAFREAAGEALSLLAGDALLSAHLRRLNAIQKEYDWLG